MRVAIIGAGPRGLSLIERLIAQQQSAFTNKPLVIDLFDPAGVGGIVWQPNQPVDLLMNTLATQITLFTDSSIQMKGAVVNGPTLYEWAKNLASEYFRQQTTWAVPLAIHTEIRELTINSYASRVLYSFYLQWFYGWLQRQSGSLVQLTFHQQAVVSLSASNQQFKLRTAEQTILVDAASLALGYSENQLTTDEQELTNFAQEQKLTYLPATQPAWADLKSITSKNTVILRGLGLSFYDYLALLTSGRGGQFQRLSGGQLVYRPSGREPKIVAGSRSGIPYHGKSRNSKKYGEHVIPHFLTPERIQQLVDHDQLNATTLWQLTYQEMAFVYYSLLVEQSYPEINLWQFQRDLLTLDNFEQVINNAGIRPLDQLDWDLLENPTKYTDDRTDFQSFFDHYLQWDIHYNQQTNQSGPLAAAIDVLRDWRSIFRWVVNEKLLSPDDYRKLFLQKLNHLNSYLAVGPPSIRIEQLQALRAAGIVHLLAPQMTVKTKERRFLTYSQIRPNHQYTATALIEARLPTFNARTATDLLIQSLLKNQLAHLQRLQLTDQSSIVTGALMIDPTTNQLLDAAGQPQKKLFLSGIPTEGLHWLTTASPHPGVNDENLLLNDRIAHIILRNED